MRVAWFGLALASLLIAVWMAHYDIVPAQYAGSFFRLDRWYGTVDICHSEERCKPISK